MTTKFEHEASEQQVIIPNQFEFKEPPAHKFLLYPLGLAMRLKLTSNDALLHAYLVDCKLWALSPNKQNKHLGGKINFE
ncbi:hypothetical protein QUF88_07210 [Bacillus sp. DX1.1]|uniref:hypothetical protein n=1 Tax=unclassified Bacillus (in: firmicutes) TaxID=185979 RepID=UPI00256FDC2E|nr:MULTISPECIES: hypothetical protein [unclassified Bacillus (in: firmicutes)]MDM5153624.1 hypothetical protein [Bacillus sp. DX1.1]WJE82572.1 hypothetical protein QRE67_04725 [Bacillus sp. DX3.1]